ncbi:MAG: MvaI/BcnI family restriction endonuclease, partial [bacterium]|nr:MvaI/BcnI family restriction endonuclease [bacterium]
MKKLERMTLPEFRRRFKELRKKGFVRTVRRGPTGVGHTLEHKLGLLENNVAFPDTGVAEVKAHRGSSSSLVTLFTFNRKV